MPSLVFHPRSSGMARVHGWFSTCRPIHGMLALAAGVLAVAAAAYPVATLIDAHLGVWVRLPQFEFRRWPFVLLAVVISPFLETAIFQYAFFKVAYRSVRLREAGWPIVVFSGLFFGIQHFYSAGYILLSACAGFVFSGGFLLAGSFKRGFWIVMGTHALVNGVALAIKWLR